MSCPALRVKVGFGNVLLFTAWSYRVYGCAAFSSRSTLEHDATVDLIREWLPDVEIVDSAGLVPDPCPFGDVYSWCKERAFIEELKQGVFRKIVHRGSKDASIAVHLRAGDYTDPSHKGNYFIPTTEFIQTGLEHLRERAGSERVTVYSNDPSFADELERDGAFDGFSVTTAPAQTSPDLLLQMQSHPAMLRTSSSLSWWACLLGDIEHVVCNAPVEFNVQSANWQIMPHWSVIPVTKK